MTGVKWIKITVDMFDDEKIRLIESMPEADTILIIWVKLLAQAGKTNASGYLLLNQNIPYNDEMLATIFRRPLNVVRMALQTFEKFGMVEIDQNSTISIANWEKHQNEDAMKKMRDDAARRKRLERERKKQLQIGGPGNLDQSRDSHVTVTPEVTQSHAIEEEEEREREEEREKKKKAQAPAAASIGNDLNPVRYFEEYLGVRLSNIQMQSLLAWQDDFGGQDEILKHAIKMAGDKNKKTFYFVENRLKEWNQHMCRNLDDVLVYEKTSYGKKPGAAAQSKGRWDDVE